MLQLRLLCVDLENRGPAVDWPNYGKLHGKKGDKRMFVAGK
jgi:hypothetical protein